MKEDSVKLAMIKNSSVSVLLCASKKISQKYVHNICTKDSADYIVSDVELPESLSEKEWR